MFSKAVLHGLWKQEGLRQFCYVTYQWKSYNAVTVRYEGKDVLKKKNLMFQIIFKIRDLNVFNQRTFSINRNRRDMGAAFVSSMEATKSPNI